MTIDEQLRRDLLAWELALARRDARAIEGGLRALVDEAFTEVGVRRADLRPHGDPAAPARTVGRRDQHRRLQRRATRDEHRPRHVSHDGCRARLGDRRGDVVPTTHFVIDTSRNGAGPWLPPSDMFPVPSVAEDWCNPPDRGLGVRPTRDTGIDLVDAFLWIKIPGESDGLCHRGSGGPEDPVRGTVDPAAGQWFPEMALELVHNANPAP